MKDIIVIVGPTGVGKTRLSLFLARKLNGEIINADSVSIYKRLNIGSAKPTLSEQKEVVHHLINIKDIDEEYSVYDYQRDTRAVIKKLQEENKTIIIVGGTGLYIKAALYDYKFTKETFLNDYSNLSNQEIYNRILEYKKNIDVHLNNRQRLVRLLNKLENNEVITNNKDKCLYNINVIGLTTDRNNLYDVINKRVDKMFDNGLLTEIESLKGYYNSSKVLNSAIGYKEFYNYLFNSKSLDDVKDEIKKNSRHYSKRQYTFFNNQFKVKYFDVDFNMFNKTEEEVLKYLI